MKIKREVNGQIMEFELTDHELWKAYDEFEHMSDIETVDFYTDNEDGSHYIPDDKIDEVANRYRNLYDRYLDNDADVRFECVRDAMKEVLGYDD